MVFLGPPGTGKTHLSIALGVAAARRGQRVAFATAHQWVNRLGAAKRGGRIDDDGYVFLDGRREDLIISGGVNVYPAEVEQVLGELAGVEEIAVYGLDDDQCGQRVCAAVVGPVGDHALAAHAREHLAPAKRPKEHHRLDDLPRTVTGKVRRLTLAADLGLEPAG